MGVLCHAQRRCPYHPSARSLHPATGVVVVVRVLADSTRDQPKRTDTVNNEFLVWAAVKIHMNVDLIRILVSVRTQQCRPLVINMRSSPTVTRHANKRIEHRRQECSDCVLSTKNSEPTLRSRILFVYSLHGN